MESQQLKKILRQYAETLYEPDDLLINRGMPPKRIERDALEPRIRKTKPTKFCTASELPDLRFWMRACNRAEKSPFVGINTRHKDDKRAEKSENGNKNVNLCRFLVADIENCDAAIAEEDIKRAGLARPTMIIDSGHGIHLYWRLKEPITDLAEWSNWQMQIATLLESDPCVAQPKGLIRLPGFFNTKNEDERVRCKIIECNPTQRYAPEEVLPETFESRLERRMRVTLPREKGTGNASLWNLCGVLKGTPELNGKTAQELLPYVQQWHHWAEEAGTLKAGVTWWDTENDFLAMYGRRNMGKGADEMDRVLKEVVTAEEVLPEAANLNDPHLIGLVAICKKLHAMQAEKGKDTFFLSCRTAAKALGIDHNPAAKRIRYLHETAKIIELVELGARPKASEFRWLGKPVERPKKNLQRPKLKPRIA